MAAQPSSPANANWHRFLPGLVRSRLDGRHGLQAILGNSTWLFADKILRMGVGLLVGIWVVRYLGPKQLGMLSYAWAFAGLFSSLANLGLDSIVIREIVAQPDKRNEYMGSAFRLKLIGGAICLSVSLGALAWLRPGDTMQLVLVGISAAGFMFQSLNVIDFYFQATVQSKFTVYSAVSAFVVMTVLKIVLLLNGAGLIWFALTGLGETILTAAFLVVAYRHNRLHIGDWTYSKALARQLLKQSWPLILSGITVMIYMRIDQIMIGQMLDDTQVGLFAASVRLSEIWYFVPAGIASSVFPALMKAKAQGHEVYLRRVQQMYDLMTWLAISVAIVTTVLAPFFVPLLYGKAFAPTAGVLSIQIWAGVVVCMSYVHSAWLIIESRQKLNLYYTGTGAVLNVVFNLILIPEYGIRGAAVATLIAQATPNLIQLFIPVTRPNLFAMLKSFTAPYRLMRERFSGSAA